MHDVAEGVCDVLVQQGPLLNAFIDNEPTHRSDQLVHSVLAGGHGTEMLSLSSFTLPCISRNCSQHLTSLNELLTGFRAMLQSQTKDCPAPQAPIA